MTRATRSARTGRWLGFLAVAAVTVACGGRLEEGTSQRVTSEHLRCQPVCRKQPFSELQSVELRLQHAALRVTWTMAGPIPLDSGSVVPPAEVFGWGLEMQRGGQLYGVGVSLRGKRWAAGAGHVPIHPPRPPGGVGIARPNTGVPISPGPVVQGNVLILDVPLKDLPGLTSGPFWWSTRTSVDAELADELPDSGHQEGDTFVARFGG